LGTLETYDQTSNFLKALDISEDEVSKSIIGAIGSLDAYQLPDAKGYSSMVRHLIGLTDKRRQQHRDEVLATTAADFKAFAEVLAEMNQRGNVVVLGSQEAIESANQARGGDWLRVQKVL
jgi:Zn-dependent M16 (insulinase) family peptidase